MIMEELVHIHFNVKLVNKTEFESLYFVGFELNEVPFAVPFAVLFEVPFEDPCLKRHSLCHDMSSLSLTKMSEEKDNNT